MIIHDPLLITNFVICSATFIRLFLFRREGARHRRWAGVLAWALMVACGSIPIRVLFGDYITADWSEVVINAVFLAAVLKSRGNVVQLFKVART